MDEEDEFNAEFDRLVQERERCPVCSRDAVELGNFWTVDDNADPVVCLYAVCEVGHVYIVEPTGGHDEEEE